ncbi:hypothetical protein ACGF0D_41235 [Kitasatospora sp. NPDC048298]|uniref:hypothetical protein n=1 Tax=Kitasatospora sp. NPDC048298 TaxID=3364049 RepID=UPI003721B417
MVYRLHQDRTVRTVRDGLPDAAADELTLALDRVLANPKATTDPYGVDDGVTRMLILSKSMAVLLVNDETLVITLVHITCLL